MEFNLSKIEFSKFDKKNGLVLPNKMTIELAEFIGIMVGDGHIGQYKDNDNQIVIAGNIRDKGYYEKCVNKIIFKLFNIKFNISPQKWRNAIILKKNSKALLRFLTSVIGLPNGKKIDIKIPSCILNNSKGVQIAFLRGLCDADFCLTIKYKPNLYPVIQASFDSKTLINQCSQIFNRLGILNNTGIESIYYAKRNKTYISYRLYINGFSRVSTFMDLIGSKIDFRLNRYEEILKTKFARK